MQEHIVETFNLTKKYKNQTAVDHVNLKVPKGSILGLVGKNGAGKTTLIRLLTDVAHPTLGSYSLLGETDPKKQTAVRSRIAAMVETPALYMGMSGHQNLMMRCILMGVGGDDKSAYVDKMMDFVGLTDVKNSPKKAKDYSLGMRQRLGIAMAIVGNPELLILDEPTNGLDPEGIKEIRDLLVALNEEKGITIIVSSHILGELSRLATYYAFMDHGKIVKEISSEDLEGESKHSLTLTTDDDEKAEEVLRASGFNVSSSNPLIVSGYHEAASPVMALAHAGIEVLSFREKSGDLEEYFLSLTKDLEGE